MTAAAVCATLPGHGRWGALVTARRTAGLLALGAALAWGTKLTLIAANGGSNDDEGVVAVAYLVGAALVLATGFALGLALTAGRPVWQRAVAGVLGVVAVMLLHSAVYDPLGEAAVGDAGPSWLPEEAGIALMVLTALVAAAVLLRGGRADAPAPRRGEDAAPSGRR